MIFVFDVNSDASELLANTAFVFSLAPVHAPGVADGSFKLAEGFRYVERRC
jgi:hypothetical protein